MGEYDIWDYAIFIVGCCIVGVLILGGIFPFNVY